MPREDAIEDAERKAHSAYDLTRMRLERLQQNIHKPAPIPNRKENLKAPRPPPDFVRNVVGSSAAAGSAEFHIFRNNRRKEMNRLEYIDKKAEMEKLSDDFQRKREEIEKAEDEKTAKKRAKRLRKKERTKKRKLNKEKEESSSESNSDSNEDEETEKNDNVANKDEAKREELNSCEKDEIKKENDN